MGERTCQLSGKKFQCGDLEEGLAKQLSVPLGQVSPPERLRRMLSFKSGKRLFQRNCDATNKRLFSVYPAGAPFPVYAPSIFYSNEWDPFSFSMEFDFKRLFAEQLLELWKRVPRPAFAHLRSEATRVSHVVREVKNAFLLFDSDKCQQCLCSVDLSACQECLDCYAMKNCSECYDCVLCENSQSLRFSDFCDSCKDSWFLYNCQDCKNCLYCVNLSGKEYHIRNKPVSRERFEEVIRGLSLSARPTLELARNDFSEFLNSQPSPHLLARQAERATGNYLRRVDNVEECYECADISNCAVCYSLRNCRDCLECVSCSDLSFSARCVNCFNGERLFNCLDCYSGLKDSAYCADCSDSEFLFGCVGLNGKQYCIFNKQYSKEEYLIQYKNIRQHLIDRNVWGAFFSAGLSGFGYNHSAAMEHMPLTRIPAQMMGFRWDDKDEAFKASDLASSAKTAEAELFSEVPTTVEELGDIANADRIYICELSGKPFQISAEETAIYLRLGMAPPAVCFEERHLLRLRRLATLQLYERKCALSGKSIRSAFGPKWRQSVAEASVWKSPEE